MTNDSTVLPQNDVPFSALSEEQKTALDWHIKAVVARRRVTGRGVPAGVTDEQLYQYTFKLLVENDEIPQVRIDNFVKALDRFNANKQFIPEDQRKFGEVSYDHLHEQHQNLVDTQILLEQLRKPEERRANLYDESCLRSLRGYESQEIARLVEQRESIVQEAILHNIDTGNPMSYLDKTTDFWEARRISYYSSPPSRGI